MTLSTCALSAMVLATSVFCGCSSDGADGSDRIPPAGSGTATGAASGPTLPDGAVGKASCDGYVTKMRACIEKMPLPDRAEKQRVLEATLAAWREQAQKPEMAQQLETSCKAAATALDADPLCK